MKQLFYLILCIMPMVACSKKNDSTAGGPPESQKGVITGKITDPSGKPLEGATVYAGHDTYYNTNVIGVSDSKGIYTLDLRGQPNGTWSIHADVVKKFNNRTFKFRVDPVNSDPLTTTEGGQRDLKWQLEGQIPGTTNDARLGGYVTFMQTGTDYIPTEEIEFILEPVGVLVDGSIGQTITRRAEVFPYNLNGLYNYEGLRDIPVGTYKISAVHKPASGDPFQLTVSPQGSSDYAASVTATFNQETAYTFQEIALLINVN